MILGSLLFNVFMNSLSCIIKHLTLSTYADDMQIFSIDNDPAKVEEAINTDLTIIDNWYEENGMGRNHEKYQAMVIGKTL